MTNEPTPKMELPLYWRKINFYSLNLSYGFAVVFGALQFGSVSKVLIKAFGEPFYDLLNGWVLLGLLVCVAGAGVLGYVRRVSALKAIDILEKKDGQSS